MQNTKRILIPMAFILILIQIGQSKGLFAVSEATEIKSYKQENDPVQASSKTPDKTRSARVIQSEDGEQIEQKYDTLKFLDLDENGNFDMDRCQARNKNHEDKDICSKAAEILEILDVDVEKEFAKLKCEDKYTKEQCDKALESNKQVQRSAGIQLENWGLEYLSQEQDQILKQNDQILKQKDKKIKDLDRRNREIREQIRVQDSRKEKLGRRIEELKVKSREKLELIKSLERELKR